MPRMPDVTAYGPTQAASTCPLEAAATVFWFLCNRIGGKR